MTTVHQVVVRHFHAFQTESNEVNSRDYVRLVQNDLNEVGLCAELDALSVKNRKAARNNRTQTSRHDTNTELQLSQQVSTALLKCLECVLVSETSPSVDDADSLFDLMAAVAVAYNVLDETFYTLIRPASVAAADRMRVLACRMMTACIKQAPQHATQLIPLLLPRFTDKAQSVRLAALIGAQAALDTEQDQTLAEPPKELTEALLWNLHHDPSWTNRCQALQSLPLVPSHIHHVIRRLRDVKPKVRVAAIHRLHSVTLDKLTPYQCAEIIRAGFTDRCKETSDATTVLLCTRWFKAAKYDPLALLTSLKPALYEAECEKVITILLQVDSDFLKDLSDAEVRAFRQGMATQPEISVLLPENLLVARLQCHLETSPAKRADMLQKIVTDIPMLCDAIQSCIETIVDQDDETNIFCCNQLFKLAQLMDLQEEGSRRHFLASCRSILAATNTPEDVLEEAIKAMGRAHDREDEYLDSVGNIIAPMTDQLRCVSILTLVLENTSPRMATHASLKAFVKHVVPAVHDDTNPMIREAGVGCLGRLALLSEEATVMADFKPLLLGIISNEQEKMEIRAQAMLALCDLTMLFDNILLAVDLDGKEVRLVDHVGVMLQNKNPSVVAVASEVATKLLFSGKVNDYDLVAALLVVFFDKKYDGYDENDDVQEVGSVYRMQQLLSLFFQAYSKKGFQLVPAIGPMLAATATKKRGRKVFPIAKMIEFVYAMAEEGLEENKDENTNNALLVCLELSNYLLHSSDNISTTSLRILCKLLGGADVDLDKASNAKLIELKENVNELTMLISDDPSLESLETMTELLEDVQEVVESGNDNDDDEVEDVLVETMGAVTLEKENPVASVKDGAPKRRTRQALGVKN